MDKKKNKVDETIKSFHSNKNKIPSDNFGSYTGSPIDKEEPVQDADDL